jgi:hypothetical protein
MIEVRIVIRTVQSPSLVYGDIAQNISGKLLSHQVSKALSLQCHLVGRDARLPLQILRMVSCFIGVSHPRPGEPSLSAKAQAAVTLPLFQRAHPRCGNSNKLLIEWPQVEAEPRKYWRSNLAGEIFVHDQVALGEHRWIIERDYRD